MAETTILGLFEDIDHAAGALNRLRGEGGTASEDLMVLSSVPFPEGVLEADRSPIRLPLITVIFAFVGIGFGIAAGRRLGGALFDSRSAASRFRLSRPSASSLMR